MFHLFAFVSTMLILILLGLIFLGLACYLRHTWTSVRLAGLVIATIAFAVLVSHLVALIVGA